MTLPAFFQTSRVSPSVRSPPSIFPFVGLRRRAEERRGFSSEGAVSLTGRPRGGFAIRGATRSFAVLSRKAAQKPRLRRVRIIGAVERGRSFSSDHLSGNLSFVSNGLSPSRDAIRI